MHKRSRPLELIVASLMGWSAIAVGQPRPAIPVSQQRPPEARHYEIPAGPLASALSRFADENGLALVYAASLAEGLRTQGISGEYTLRAALDRLLSETGLTFRFTRGNTVVIEKIRGKS